MNEELKDKVSEQKDILVSLSNYITDMASLTTSEFYSDIIRTLRTKVNNALVATWDIEGIINKNSK